MKSLKKISTYTGSITALALTLLFLFQGAALAQTKPLQPTTKPQLQESDPVSYISSIKACPDLQVGLKISKNSTGTVTLRGSVSNVGLAAFDTPSTAEIYMNLSYPPKTYNQVGVSEKVCSIEFTTLAKDDSIVVHCSFNIADFGGWESTGKPGNAKRLFSLRAVKESTEPYEPLEDCHPENNSKQIEVGYQDTQH